MPTHKRHPLYIGATASTPIAAVLILKGLSPGAALVFLLTGPATNMATLTVLVNVLGKRATAIYLAAIAVFAVLSGLAVDQVYALLGISAKAAARPSGGDPAGGRALGVGGARSPDLDKAGHRRDPRLVQPVRRCAVLRARTCSLNLTPPIPFHRSKVLKKQKWWRMQQVHIWT